MNQKQRTIIALAALFVVAGTSYAFLEWQQGPTPFDPKVTLFTSGTTTAPTATTTPATPMTPPPTESEHAFGTVTLRLNEAASFPGGLTIRPTRVLEDSRCPLGVMCIQAGTVRVSVRVQSALGTSASTFAPDTTVTTEAETITLLEVTPVKHKDELITDADYRFIFKVTKREMPPPSGQCYIGGCSAQLCTDQPNVASTCEYRPEYGCYKTATCERQPNGQCGWTPTPELTSCLANPPEEE